MVRSESRGYGVAQGDAVAVTRVTCRRNMPLDDEEVGEVIAHARASANGYGSYLCEDSARVSAARVKRLGILSHAERLAALELA